MKRGKIGIKITSEGLAQAMEILNRDGALEAAELQTDPHKALASMIAICEQFMAQSRQRGNARTEEEKTDCYLIAIFHAWCAETLKAMLQ